MTLNAQRRELDRRGAAGRGPCAIAPIALAVARRRHGLRRARGAGSFRAAPSVLIEPLQDDFGWSRGTISAAVMVNLILYGLTSPFAAALMDRFGMRVVVAGALSLIAIGSVLTLFMTESWQLILCWGVLVGLGAGSMALAFVATVTNRWFVKRKGLVTGILTAGGAAGQLVFLPLLAWLAEHHSWKSVSLTVSVRCARGHPDRARLPPQPAPGRRHRAVRRRRTGLPGASAGPCTGRGPRRRRANAPSAQRGQPHQGVLVARRARSRSAVPARTD